MEALLGKIKDDPILPEPKHLHLTNVFIPDTHTYIVSVENPRKVGDKNAYVSYTVKVTRRAENTTTIVDRRYSDFDWLWEHLKYAHPSCVVPQIPEKSLSGNFEEGLMAFRARELTRFLQRVLAHPLMSTDDAVQIFITATEEEFAARRKEGLPKEGWFASLKRAASTAMGAQEDPDPWFKEKADDVLSREILLTQLLQTVQRMIMQYQALSKVLASHVSTLRDFMTGLDTMALKDVFEADCQALGHTKELVDDMVCQLSVTVNGNILDYIHELQAINSLIERRVPLVRAYVAASKEGDASEAQSQLDQFSNAARADIQQVCEIRNGDMERFFAAINRFNQEYYQILSTRWDSVLGNSPGVMPAATDAAIADADGAFGGRAAETTTTTTTSVF